jgi:hypothetical protein
MAAYLRSQKGAALLIALGILAMLSFIGIATVTTSSIDISISGSDKRATQALYLAEAGLERASYGHLWGGFYDESLSPMVDLFSWLESQQGVSVYSSERLGSQGSYSVSVTSVTDPGTVEPFAECREVTLESVGRVAGGSETRTVRETFRMGTLPAGVFDYGYFMNHFGWFAGFPSGKAVINGNVRTNGHFDVLSGYVTINGNPRYDQFSGAATDHGGVYSGGYVKPSSGQGYKGMAQYAENRHSYGGADSGPTDPAVIPMPNLNDAGDADGDGNVQELNPYYLRLANGELGSDAGRVGIDANGDGTLQTKEVIFSGTYGDDRRETGNVILSGTKKKPILVEGPVVVTGNLVIKGKVSGQGAFYVGRNTYVADDITYLNSPSKPPVYDYGRETAAEYKNRVNDWIEANHDKDLVSFQTRESIVVGDFTKSSWTRNITGSGGWLRDYRNDGEEDVGVDGVFGSLDSPDNPYAASEKENDGYWTVEIYNTSTGEREIRDLRIAGGGVTVPGGWRVVPGTGEDVDGDGEYDGSYSQSQDIDFDVGWKASNWLNFDSKKKKYSKFAANQVRYIDGMLYTNHALAGSFKNQSEINGAVIARNECMVVYGAKLSITHDPRLIGIGKGGASYGVYLSQVKAMISVGWEED